ncbi:hypothetical protein [Actomonas aquatica]|uniref:DUF3619 domain-containing protein n=1 Tax=Actomonas aquatica TaxID=2866162 RepID=A0ABZ1CD73_9BACT|nr:hypothetical protein [Opitutus sp. WL0086]WRQ89257.1 hypothetical protein K1X11_007545 [Opitutus sp. WL0086]
MNRKPTELERLLARARAAGPEVSGDEHVVAPPGFATRVVALAWAGREDAGSVSLLQLLMAQGRRALVVSAVVALMAVAFNLPAVVDHIEYDVLSGDDPVTAMMDFSE